MRAWYVLNKGQYSPNRTAFAILLAGLGFFVPTWAWADQVFDTTLEHQIASAIEANADRLQRECESGCDLDVSGPSSPKFEFKPLRLGDFLSFQVIDRINCGGSGGCFFAIFSFDDGQWKKIFEWQGQLTILPSKTQGYFDLVAGRSGTTFIWNGRKYEDGTNRTTSAALPPRPTGPTFPCPAPRDPLAQLICSDPALSHLDRQFVQVYQALRQQIGESGHQDLRREAINFNMSVRNTCGIATAQSVDARTSPQPASIAATPCVAQAYNARKLLWMGRLTGAAAEEAVRPVEQQIGIQIALQRKRFLPESAETDGVFGPATRSAIIAWQTTSGRTPTGLLSNTDAQALLQTSNPMTAETTPLPVANQNTLSVGTETPKAQSLQIDCGLMWEGNAQGETVTLYNPLGGKSPKIPVINISVEIHPDHRNIFNSFSQTISYLNSLRDNARKTCANDISLGKTKLDRIPNTYLVGIFGTRSSSSAGGFLRAFQGQETSGQGRFLSDWVIRSNTLGSTWTQDQTRSRIEQEQRQAEIRAQEQKRLEQEQKRLEDERVSIEKTKPVSVVSGPLSEDVARCVKEFFPSMGFSAPLFGSTSCSDFMRVDEVKTIDTRDIPGGIEVMVNITVIALRPFGGSSMIAGSCLGGTTSDIQVGRMVQLRTRIQFEKWHSGLRCISRKW